METSAEPHTSPRRSFNVLPCHPRLEREDLVSASSSPPTRCWDNLHFEARRGLEWLVELGRAALCAAKDWSLVWQTWLGAGCPVDSPKAPPCALLLNLLSRTCLMFCQGIKSLFSDNRVSKSKLYKKQGNKIGVSLAFTLSPPGSKISCHIHSSEKIWNKLGL